MGTVNSSTSAGPEPKPGSRDPLRLFVAAIACGVLALCVFPFEPPILRACNVDAQSSALGFWHWMDRIAPPVLLTLSPVLGLLVLFVARPSEKSRRAALVLLTA